MLPRFIYTFFRRGVGLRSQSLSISTSLYVEKSSVQLRERHIVDGHKYSAAFSYAALLRRWTLICNYSINSYIIRRVEYAEARKGIP